MDEIIETKFNPYQSSVVLYFDTDNKRVFDIKSKMRFVTFVSFVNYSIYYGP